MTERGELAGDPFGRLRALTEARIGLGHAGPGLPTAASLKLQLDHARACDAVHTALDVPALQIALGRKVHVVHSAAADRATYLQRPDLGRRLAPEVSLPRLGGDLAIVIADGLSATAIMAHAAAVVAALPAFLPGWTILDPVIALQGRVALGDAIGEQLGARSVLVLIGERPGLSAADSLGAYLTWAPRIGRRDHERNCVSNIRVKGGLAPERAAANIAWLLGEARRIEATGVVLKDRFGDGAPTLSGPADTPRALDAPHGGA
ncbi:ethanolamine ammonia-lyase subunit EutC [Novosphingobium sp. 1949]|uniref:Ethanolamine ammonia-lyase small subunit n=1 Tax=Novosphingobium organovorum TaxID=2930092 RepID=A0ABT0BBU0_9SPHN|nr:ethanolamine ammonia-lyase subunit EutC [Novosphingobium organovorum]MCJ2182526.1 ethanolamine ammonia-lyase subunit EutC [Novosphingobium organovorum]